MEYKIFVSPDIDEMEIFLFRVRVSKGGFEGGGSPDSEAVIVSELVSD